MLNWESLGPTPAGESCVGIGDDDYAHKAGSEIRKYRELMKMKFPDTGKYGCEFRRKSFRHDFGTYYELVITFDDSRTESSEYAYFVEGKLPEYWTDTKVETFKSEINEYA